MLSLATGVIGTAAVSVASPSPSSPGALLFLTKNLKERCKQQFMSYCEALSECDFPLYSQLNLKYIYILNINVFLSEIL